MGVVGTTEVMICWEIIVSSIYFDTGANEKVKKKTAFFNRQLNNQIATNFCTNILLLLLLLFSLRL